MSKRLQAMLVYGFAITSMTYAIWQADITILPISSADWANGCCVGSNDCGGNFICWNKPAGWSDCSVTQYYDPSCECFVPVIKPNYCNPPSQPPGGGGGKGPGDIL
jgi:hypothetical protein